MTNALSAGAQGVDTGCTPSMTVAQLLVML